MNRRKLLFLAVALALVTPAQAAEYTIDPGHSKVLFKAKHLGISTVTGRFDKFSGSYEFDPKDFKSAKVSATIESASVNTDNERRDTHLKSADFLEAAKYPQLTFVSKEVKNVGEGKFKVTGDMTLHGVTKPITLDAEFGGIAKDRNSERSAFNATGKINRKDFGLTWSRLTEAGGLVVGEEITIILEIEGIRKN